MTDNDSDDLEQRVEQLEETVTRMLPNRRQTLRLGGTALAGGLLGVGASASASAGSNQVGTIGSAGNLVDIEAEDVSATSVDTATIIDSDDGTTYDVGDDLAGGGALVDSGTDTDGGDDYQMPNAADNIDLQADGAIQSAESVNTDNLTAKNVVVTQSNISSVTRYTADRVTVGGKTYETIFNVTGTTDVIYGYIIGPQSGKVRVTWEDGTQNFISSARTLGGDNSGDLYSANIIPPIKDASKLEFRNDKSSGSADYGYEVVTI